MSAAGRHLTAAMTEPRIVFDHVWKKFHRGEVHDSLRDLIPAKMRRLVGRVPRDELGANDFWAVRDLSFDVGPGKVLGIIGANGSGKSTSLKMLTRILRPTRGCCAVTGRVGALIEVSAGFHQDLTGRENIFLQGAIMGMRLKDIERKFDDIVEFSGISAFLDTPVKRYSSGMSARLGFSVAAHLDPDVLVIDEVLAVGDFAFQERAYRRIRHLAQSGIPVVIVSHQLERIADLCTDVVLLEAGHVKRQGTPQECIAAYIQGHSTERESGHASPIQFRSMRVIEGERAKSGGWCTLRIEGRVTGPMPDTLSPLQIRFRSLSSGQSLFVVGSRALGAELPAAGPFVADLRLQANVSAGNYLVEVSAYDAVADLNVAWAPHAMIAVRDEGRFRGTVQLNPELRITSVASE